MSTPRKLAIICLRELKAAGDHRTAAQSQYYFKSYDSVSFFGVRTPRVREIEKNLYQSVRGTWQLSDALEFSEILIKKPELEAKHVGLLTLGRFKRSFDESLIDNVEVWLARDLCNNWATTDALCSLVLSPLIGEYDQLLTRMEKWSEDKNLWLRRASIVSLVPHVRHGRFLDFAYRLSEQAFKYPEDLIHKANGWMLREAGKTDPGRLEEFLILHGPQIPRTTIRYAIEKFAPAMRKRLLSRTQKP